MIGLNKYKYEKGLRWAPFFIHELTPKPPL